MIHESQFIVHQKIIHIRVQDNGSLLPPSPKLRREQHVKSVSNKEYDFLMHIGLITYRRFFFVTFLLCLIIQLHAQKTKKHISLRDSLDGMLDVSDYVIDANGFIPVPYIITEPAMGGFGLAIAPIFINKNPAYVDTINGKVVRTPVAPTISGGVGIYTLNESWATMAFRSGTFIKQRIKYTVFGGYASFNMSFYKTFDQLGEKELKFNIKTLPILLQFTKRLGYSNWYAGIKYLFLKNDLTFKGDASLKNLVDSVDFNRTISQPGIIVELDKRDNIFTPNKGLKFHTDFSRSDDAFGSDYDFSRLNTYMYLYIPLTLNLTGGLRLDAQQTWEDVPFYMLPYIDMRGVPIYRYQGKADILTEMEFRWDFAKSRRWSLMLYSGAGKAFDEWSEFGSKDLVVTYGTGFRYLLARKFKLRVGIDLARGPDIWAYYIVFGSNWLK